MENWKCGKARRGRKERRLVRYQRTKLGPRRERSQAAGTVESAFPNPSGCRNPSVEKLGYFQLSLRDISLQISERHSDKNCLHCRRSGFRFSRARRNATALEETRIRCACVSASARQVAARDGQVARLIRSSM